MLTHLLDTSVYSQPIKNVAHEAVMRRWSDMDERSLCTSAICHSEVLRGLMLRQSERYWGRYRALIEGHYPLLPFDATTGLVLAELQTELGRVGKTKPLADLMIAATARQHGLIVATLNHRDFHGIPGVAVEDWSR